MHPRERIALPLRVGLHRAAVTRDVSAGGLFVHVDGHHGFAGELDFELELPEARIRFRSCAKVVRVEFEAGVTGVALRLVGSRLEPSDDGSLIHTREAPQP